MTKKIEEIIADKIELDSVCDDANIAIETANTEAPETSPLNSELIEKRVGDLVRAASAVFFEPVQRHLATNGKAYPVDFDFDARALKGRDGVPVEGTGEIVTRDRYAFLNQNLARLQCSGLDMMLRNQKEQITKQRNSIQSELRFARNTGSDDAGKIDRMADWLEQLIEQAAIVETALHAAVEHYSLEFGEDYVPKEQAAQVVKARVDNLSPAMKARLASLGATPAA